MIVPADVGRVPHKIQSGFSGFTADQLKNWVTIYSIPALFDLLPSEHFECWRHFVLACRILCRNSISYDSLKLADALLIKFCKRVEILYGEEAITPNMHLHCHICEIVKDYGPVQEFWLFSFERYNGLMGNQPTNNRNIEPQLMKRFLRDNFAFAFTFPAEFEQDFASLCSFNLPTRGSAMKAISCGSCDSYNLPSHSTRSTLCNDDLQHVALLYSRLKKSSQTIHANSVFIKYASITISGIPYNTGQKCVALVKWDSSLFMEQPTILEDSLRGHPDFNYRPVKVHCFAKCSVYTEGGNSHDQLQDTIVLALVSWYYPHTCRYMFGKPVQLWCSSKFEIHNTYSFVPVSLFSSRCAHCVKTVNDVSLLVIVPLVEGT